MTIAALAVRSAHAHKAGCGTLFEVPCAYQPVSRPDPPGLTVLCPDPSWCADLHSINVLHGDLKTRNALLKSARNDRRGFVIKLADFGLSRCACGAHQQVGAHGPALRPGPGGPLLESSARGCALSTQCCLELHQPQLGVVQLQSTRFAPASRARTNNSTAHTCKANKNTACCPCIPPLSPTLTHPIPAGCLTRARRT